MTRFCYRLSITSLIITLVIIFVMSPQYIYLVGGVNIVNTCALLVFLFYLIKVRKLRKSDLQSISWLIWLYYFFILGEYIASGDIIKSFSFALSFLIIPLIVQSIVNSESKFYQIVDYIINGGFILGFLGLVEEIVQLNFFQLLARQDTRFFHEFRYGLLRIMSTFGQPIGYGVFQVFIIALIIYRRSTQTNRKQFLNVCYIVCVINVLLTVSRIPILMLVMMHLLLLFMVSTRKSIRFIILFVIVVPIVVVLVSTFGIKTPLISDLIDTVGLVLDGGTATGQGTVGVGNRFDLWVWVPSMMNGHWIWGNGIDSQFAYQMNQWSVKTSIENQYLHTMYYSGVVGLVFLLMSYFTTLRFTYFSRKKRNKYETDITFNGMCFMLLVSYYVTEFGIQETDMMRFYVIVLALIMSYNRILVDNNQETVV